MRRYLSASALALLISAVFCSAAYATFSGVNGRIVFTVPDYLPASDLTVRSICPDGTGNIPIATNAIGGVPSPDGTKIAYVHPVDAQQDIWVANADGSDPQQITNDPYTNEWPTWSPDGTKLTYHRYAPNTATLIGAEMPYIVDIAAKVPIRLTTDDTIRTPHGAGPNRWSPDGQRIYFEGTAKGVGDDSDNDIYWAPAAANGTATKIIGTGGFPFSQYMDLSPDGTKMLVTRQDPGPTYENDPFNTNWLYTLGGGSTFLSNGVSMAGNAGREGYSFSPDGTKVVYNKYGYSGQPTVEQLTTSDVAGTNEQRVGSGTWGALAQWSSNTDGCSGLGGSGGMRINEVSLASGASPAAQFVELIDTADETFPDGEAPFKLAVYDGNGAKTGAHEISKTLLQGRDNTQPLLISTTASDTAYAVTGHEVLELALPNPGQACFTRGTAETKVSCVTWGCVATPVSPTIKVTAPAAGSSVQRQGAGSTTFQSGSPTPKAANVAGAASPPCVPPTGGSGNTGGGGGAPAADTLAPNTTGKIAKKLKLAKRAKTVTAKFVFAATEAGSTFRCKLDKAALKTCRSPLKAKLKKGRHKLTVIATDAAGNADPTPLVLSVNVTS